MAKQKETIIKIDNVLYTAWKSDRGPASYNQYTNIMTIVGETEKGKTYQIELKFNVSLVNYMGNVLQSFFIKALSDMKELAKAIGVPVQ